MAFDNYVNLSGWFIRDVSKSVSRVFQDFLSSLCDRKIGPGIAVHCAGVICCAKLRNQSMCAVDLMLMAETRSILQALP